MVQYVAPGRVSRQLGYPVLEPTVRLAEDAPHGFPRDWSSPLPMGPERHMGYAVQWFVLGAAVLMIYLAVNLKKRGKQGGGDVAPS